MDKNSAISVLQEQITKLTARDFDLNAWKNFSILLLERIFGKDTRKIEAIQKIKYDQGSWVLRDQTGYTNSMEACKKMGKEILGEAIVELEAFGPPEVSGNLIDLGIIVTALEDELTGSQVREIKKILAEEKSAEDKKKLIMTKLKSYGPDTAFAIVANILTREEVRTGLIRES
jgi:hypothetical protein